MGRKRRLNQTAILGCLASALSMHAQNLLAGKGRAEFQRICSNCHSLDIATAQRLSKTDWAGTVRDMVSRGAQGSSAELRNVVRYLSTNFGPTNKSDTATPAPAHETPQEAPAANAAPPPVPRVTQDEIAKANKTIQANGCLSCHRVGHAGSYIAPDLSDIGDNLSSEQIRAALVSPNKEVRPENRTVKMVTNGGTPATGRILNQDGFSVQLITSEGQLETYLKADLRDFTIIPTNPMPSYTDMRADDLTDLIHYLSSLRGPTAQ
jgi:putative heme-binding domain-containing protein